MSDYRNFHDGEVALQREAGVDIAALDAMCDEIFAPELSATEQRFINGRTFAVAGTIDPAGHPWATPLFGEAGRMFQVQPPTDVVISPRVPIADDLADNIAGTGLLGVLFFQPERRRRSKSTGTAELRDDGTIHYSMQRHYGLCNKYIFKREHTVDDTWSSQPTEKQPSTTSATLSDADQQQLGDADTIFLTSFHAGHGVDVTHRGGPRGFVTSDESTVRVPDYLGNAMFQTMGNLRLDDRIGFSSVDFSSGRIVQVSGRGFLEPSPSDDIYSERTVRIDVEAVRTHWVNAGDWHDVEPFDIKPGLINPGTPFL